jgi:hypothetical protein
LPKEEKKKKNTYATEFPFLFAFFAAPSFDRALPSVLISQLVVVVVVVARNLFISLQLRAPTVH